MVVQLNLNAMNYSRRIDAVSSLQAKSLERTPSENRINKSDDAAGLSISNNMKNKMRGSESSTTRAQESVSSVQKVEDALSKIHSNLQRMREYAVEAADETKSTEERDRIKSEMTQLSAEIDHIAETTKVNDTYILKGAGYAASYATMVHGSNMDYAALASDYAKEEYNARVEKNKCNFGSDEYNDWDRKEAYWRSRKLECEKLEQVNEKEPMKLELHAGSDADMTNKISVEIKAMDTASLGLKGIDASNVDAIDKALTMVSDQSAKLGEAKDSVENSIMNLNNEAKNTVMTEEMMENVKKNILAQANQAMLAQANQMSQSVMMLLQ